MQIQELIVQYPALVAIIVFFLLLALGRWIYFNGKLRKSIKLLNLFEHHFSPESISSPNYDWTLAERQPEIKKLFQEAGLVEGSVLHTQEVLNVGIASATMSTWENITLLDREVVDNNRMAFHRLKGYFEDRRNETCDIIYWIELLISWPRYFLAYLGLSKDSLFGKILQVPVLIAEIALILDTIVKILDIVK